MGVLSQELAALYDATVNGKHARFRSSPSSMRISPRGSEKRMQGDFFEKQLAYWKDQLQGAPPVLELPTDRPRLAAETFRGAWPRLVFQIGSLNN